MRNLHRCVRIQSPRLAKYSVMICKHMVMVITLCCLFSYIPSHCMSYLKKLMAVLLKGLEFMFDLETAH